MIIKPLPDSRALRAEKQRNGLIYGLLTGLAFAAAAWGYDALALSRAHAAIPWLKFLLGLALALPVCGFAGWLTAGRDSAIVGFITWLAAGIVLAWATSRLPFNGIFTTVLAWIDPEVAERVNYPYNDSAAARAIFIFWATLIAMGILGLLEMLLVDSAAGASSLAGRWMPLAVGIPVMILVGIVVDNTQNVDLREPVVVVDQTVDFALANAGQHVDSRVARAMHLGAVAPVQDLLSEKRRLVVGAYDDSFVLVDVLLEMEGNWLKCQVVNAQLSFCSRVGEANAPALAQPAANQAQPPKTQPAKTQADTLGPDTTPAITQLAAEPVAEPAAALLSTVEGSLPDLSQAPRYDLSLDIDYEGRAFSGRAVIDYTNTESDSLDRLYLRLLPNGHQSYGNGSLAVSQVQVGGQPAQTALSLSDTVLEVSLPASLAPGESTQLEMTYEGRVPKDFGGTQTPAGYGIYNLSQGVMALSGWYPILAVYDQDGWNLDPVSPIGDSVYSDMAFYTVDLAVPQGLVVAATGVAGEAQPGGSKARYRYESGPTRDFFLIMSPEFQHASRQVDGTLVNSYFLPQHRAGGEAALQDGAKSLQVFNEKIGVYPYTELDIVEAPMRNASGVEYPGIVLIGAGLYDDYEDPAFTVTVSHEVAHQWWYNVVGNDVFEEPWLDEGLATYTSGLYTEAAYGKDYLQGLVNYWQDRYDTLRKDKKDDSVTEDLAHFEALREPRIYAGVVYNKAALFFHALRKEIGDQAFFQALEDYYRQESFKIATGEDLLSAFESASGRSLDDFYARWLEAPQNP